MSDKAFAKMMDQIAAQAEAEEKRELKTQRRRQLFSRLRTAFMFLLWAGVLGCGYIYRAELQQFVSEKFLTNKPQIDGSTGQALKGIQAQADKRDQILNEIAKTK